MLKALTIIAALSAIAPAGFCSQEIDIVAEARAYVPIVVQFGIELPITLSVTDKNGQPAPDVEVRLVWGDADRTIITDRDGRAAITVIKPMWSTGAKLFIPEPYKGEIVFPDLNVKVIAKAEIGNGAEAAEVTLEGLEKLEYRGVLIYYPKGREKLAWEMLDWLSMMRKYIIGSLDLTPVTPYGLAFFDTEEKFLTISDTGGVAVLPFSIRHLGPKEQSLEISWAGIHEWTELSLVTNKRLYFIDNRLRFAGDGLAEYAAFVFCRRNAKDALRRRFAGYIERCDQMLSAGISEYDLTEFQAHVTAAKVKDGEEVDLEALAKKLQHEFIAPEGEADGYPMSFWFWWDLVERKRPDIARRFVRALDGVRSLEDVVAVLEELAGEKIDLSPSVAGARAAFESYLRRFH